MFDIMSSFRRIGRHTNGTATSGLASPGGDHNISELKKQSNSSTRRNMMMLGSPHCTSTVQHQQDGHDDKAAAFPAKVSALRPSYCWCMRDENANKIVLTTCLSFDTFRFFSFFGCYSSWPF
jgi:hypothetical protein